MLSEARAKCAEPIHGMGIPEQPLANPIDSPKLSGAMTHTTTNFWQGKKDSNLRMLESKSSALTNLATPLHGLPAQS